MPSLRTVALPKPALLVAMLSAVALVIGTVLFAASAAIGAPPSPPTAGEATTGLVPSSIEPTDVNDSRPSSTATGQTPPSEASLWDKVQTVFLNSWIGVAILAVLAVAGSAAKLLEDSGKFAALLARWRGPAQATLKIAPLAVGTTVEPLDGCPTVAYHGQPTLTDGFKLKLALTHGREARESIAVTDIQPMVRYVAPKQADLPSYVVDASKLAPQGLVLEATEFLMRVAGAAVADVYWFDGKSRSSTNASPANLLETHPPRTISLDSETNEIATLPGAVKVSEPGYYEISFTIKYLVRGMYKAQQVGPVRVLKGG